MQNVLGDLEFSILREILFKVPTPTSIENAHEHSTYKIYYED